MTQLEIQDDATRVNGWWMIRVKTPLGSSFGGIGPSVEQAIFDAWRIARCTLPDAEVPTFPPEIVGDRAEAIIAEVRRKVESLSRTP
jgi:hypothetical protein